MGYGNKNRPIVSVDNQQLRDEVNAQLAEKATKTEVDSKVAQIVSGSPKGTYATISALQSAFPTGATGVYVVTADGKWYYWNGTAWTAGGVYQATSIGIGEITPTKTNFLPTKPTTRNLYNPNAPTREAGKLLNADGTTTANATYEITEYIDISGAEKVFISRTNTGPNAMVRGFAFYDTNKVWLNGESKSDGSTVIPLTVPANAVYVRVCHNPADTNYQIEKGSRKTDYVAYSELPTIDETKVNFPKPDSVLTPLKGKKVVFNGDSITEGYIPYSGENYYKYADRVADAFGMTISNHAIGGSTIAVKESVPTERDPIVTRYSSMADGDLIIIAAGTNDWQYNHTPLGTMADRTNYTFYGALHNLCLGLVEKYSGKQIMFMTPIKRSQDPYLTPESVNGNGKTLKEYADIIKEVCGYYGIPVLDMFRECPLNPAISTQKTVYVPDGTHPNTAGHGIMARRVIGFLKQLI
jgi:lysophospholipase L1-like esterase